MHLTFSHPIPEDAPAWMAVLQHPQIHPWVEPRFKGLSEAQLQAWFQLVGRPTDEEAWFSARGIGPGRPFVGICGLRGKVATGIQVFCYVHPEYGHKGCPGRMMEHLRTLARG